MFERFTDQARRVVVLAQEEARTLGHNWIGTEHLLLGLLREDDSVAARALDGLGVRLDAAREQVQEIIGPGQGQQSGHIPFTPRTKKVLELSLREARHLGNNFIGTEHLLLGLVREGEGVGAQVLVRLGAGLDEVRARVTDMIHIAPTERSAAGASAGARVFGSRVPAESLAGRIAEVVSRLDEISARLTAIETLLAEIRNPPVRAARKPPSGARKTPAAGQRTPSGGAQRKPPAGDTAPPGRKEPLGQEQPPAAEA